MDNKTNAFYDAIAKHYPMFYKDWNLQLEREGLGLRALFRNKGIQRVLDVGCGAGTQTVPMAKLGLNIVAVDPSVGMLQKCSDTAEEHGVLENILFERADFLELPKVVSGKFDAIICKGNSLPHLLTDEDIETTLHNFYEFLRPGGMVVIGMRDFGPFMEARPRFIPNFAHVNEDGSEFITFDVWEWDDGPPVIATQNLYIVKGTSPDLETVKHRVIFRPLSTDEVKVVLLEAGFENITDTTERLEQILVAYKP